MDVAVFFVNPDELEKPIFLNMHWKFFGSQIKEVHLYGKEACASCFYLKGSKRNGDLADCYPS